MRCFINKVISDIKCAKYAPQYFTGVEIEMLSHAKSSPISGLLLKENSQKGLISIEEKLICNYIKM